MLFGMTDFNNGKQHSYSFAVVGLHVKSRMFATRSAANEFMYNLVHKNNLVIESVWDDHHDKTYNCSNGVTFYIQRM